MTSLPLNKLRSLLKPVRLGTDDGVTLTELLVTVFSVSLFLIVLVPAMSFLNRGARAQINEQHLQDSINHFFTTISRDIRNAHGYERETEKLEIITQDQESITYQLVRASQEAVLKKNNVALIEFTKPITLKNFSFDLIEEGGVHSIKITIDVSVPPTGGTHASQPIDKVFSTVITRRNPT